ncbi:MAG: PspA/IM30 family protein [Candidatus Acidiferrales bacterium]
MPLLERVSTLIRANLNDLVDRAEDPGKMIKQVILDMENQYLQVKTQVAIAIADLHMLEKKKKENEAASAEWLRKAEKAVDKQQDDMARLALERYHSFQQLSPGYEEQVTDQRTQVEGLKTALQKLEQKLVEAKSKRDMLIARHRRSLVASRASRAEAAMADPAKISTFGRMEERVHRAEAVASAEKELAGEDVTDRFERLEKNEEVERLLAQMKERRALNP